VKVDTEAIRARADAATKGPWRRNIDCRLIDGNDECAVLYFDHNTHVGQFRAREQDVNFIAAARTDVPALCDRIEELEAALRGMLRRLDVCGSEMPWDGRDGVDPAKAARAALAGK
jgi:hypothetical protein